MSVDSGAPSASLKRQIPSFVAVGVFGYFVDASVTYGLVRNSASTRSWRVFRPSRWRRS